MTKPRHPPTGGWVSLSFDDGIDEHLDHVIPLLESRGLAGTFYAHLTSDAFVRRLSDWCAAAEQGHELGNHTLFHPADRRKTAVREGQAIDTYTVDRMQLELETVNRLLEALTGQSVKTFAYPFANTQLGQSGFMKRCLYRMGIRRRPLLKFIDFCRLDIGASPKSYIPVVSKLFVAARCSGLRKPSTVPSLVSLDRFQLPSVPVHGWTAAELKQFAARALEVNRWVIFQFHGVGGGHPIDCDLPAFRSFITWLGDHHASRVGTIRQIAERLWPAPATVLAQRAVA